MESPTLSPTHSRKGSQAYRDPDDNADDIKVHIISVAQMSVYYVSKVESGSCVSELHVITSIKYPLRQQ